MIKPLIIFHIKNFEWIKFSLSVLIFSAVLLIYHLNSSEIYSFLELINDAHKAPENSLDIVASIVWTIPYILLIFFLGSHIEDDFNSKLIILFSRVSRFHWYLSKILFFFIICLYYLILEAFMFNFGYLVLHGGLLLLVDPKNILLNYLAITLSMLVFTNIFHVLSFILDLRYCFFSLLFLIAFSLVLNNSTYSFYIPGNTEMITTLANFEYKSFIISFMYLIILIAIGYLILRKKNLIGKLN